MNSKVNISTSNVFDERYNKFSNSRRAAKLQEKFKDKSFDERTAKFAIVAIILVWTCTAFSGFSAHFFILDILKRLGNVLIAMLLTASVILVIEYGKRDTLPQLFKNYFQYKKIDKTNLAMSIFLIGLSVFSSFQGSHLLPSQMADAPNGMISIDSLTNAYTAAIANKKNEAAAYFNSNNWKGKLDNSSRPTYNRLVSEKIKLENEMKTAIEGAKLENQTTITQHQQKLQSEGVQLGYITLFTEFILVVMIGFIEYRDFRSISQFAHIENHESDEVNIQSVKSVKKSVKSVKSDNNNDDRNDDRNEPNQDTSNTGRTIVEGFKKGKSNDNRKDNGNTRNCKHCDKEFTYKHWNKQYCSDACRVKSWEARTGKQLGKKDD